MNYHIVRTNDKLETIINLYNLNVNELIDLNKHISNWNNLIPGTRIKLPVISESLSEELNDIEPFIEDYYPKIDLKRFESYDGSDNNQNIIEKVEEKIEDEIEDETENVEQESENIVYNKEEEKQTKKSNFTNSIKLPYNYYYDPYNYYRRRKVK